MSTIAEKIINKLGGHQKTADFLGLDVSRVYRWTYPKERGGTGGTIPSKHMPVILTVAANEGIDLKPDDFFNLPKNTNKKRSSN